MKQLTCNISIGTYKFDFVHSVEVDSSWDLLTDNAIIKLPSKLKLDKDSLKSALKRGDEVEIKLGYDNTFKTVFKGYLTRIKPTTPIELICEDEMWKLKQININTSFKGGDLKTFLEGLFPGVIINAFNLEMSPFHASNINGAELLDKIKSEYTLYSFFRNGELVIGKQYDPNDYSKHIFKIDHNMESDDLEYMTKDDLQILVKAISNNPDGTKTEIELGDKGGDTTTLNFFNLNKTELKKIAEKEIDRLKYDGWRGGFTAFGEPFVKHGDVIDLRHEKESDKTGSYWVDGVMYTFGVNGYRQEIKLGPRT